MNRILSKIYNDPSHPASFSTADKLWKATDKTFPKNKVIQWLQSQNAYTLHKPARKRFQRNRYVIDNIDDLWQADLNDMSTLKEVNDGYVYLLTVVDAFSKYAWCVPLFRKTGIEVSEAFEKIFKQSKRKPVTLMTDAGTEFKNNIFQRFLKKHRVKYYHSSNDVKACLVERLNRTLKTKMWRYFTLKNTRRYINILSKLMTSYNHSIHRSIKMAPIDVNDNNIREVWYNLYGDIINNKIKKQPPKLKEGDYVRISKEKMKFEKGYEQNWSEEIFVIKKVILRKPVVYEIKDLKEEDIRGTFYEKELQKVIMLKSAKYKIDKIIDSRGRGVRKQLLVS